MLTRYRYILILAIITAVSYLAVDIVYTVAGARLGRAGSAAVTAEKPAEKKAPTRISAADSDIIVTRNLFASARRAAAGKQSVNVDELQATSLNLVLLGTVAGEGDFGFAVILDSSTKLQKLYKVGDSVGSATVQKVMRGKVVISVGGKDEVLTMVEQPVAGAGEKAAGAEATPAVGHSIPVKKEEIDTALKDLNAIMSDVRVRPNFTGGQPDGFMVTRIKEGSLFEKMGMKNGDIIRGVNDKPLGSADDMLALYQQLKSGSQVNLNIRRQGKEELLKYSFQ